MPRTLTTHQINSFNTEHVTVTTDDDAGPGGASHHYTIAIDSGEIGWSLGIHFQKGPVKEAGVNGVSDEALFAILIDRLQGFQKGQYSCRENAVALTHLETALLWLQHRTRARQARGVEGTSAV